MLTMATLLFFAAIKDNPIPNALTLLFISPFIVAILSPFILGERFDFYIGIGVVIGFMGVIVVLQPNSDEFQPSLLFAIVAGVCYGLYIILTKKLSFRAPPVLTLFYSAMVGLLILTPLVIPSWKAPDLSGVLLGAAMGFSAAASHFMIIKAFEFASASELSPFNYFEIVGSYLIKLFGIWFYSKLSSNTWPGYYYWKWSLRFLEGYEKKSRPRQPPRQYYRAIVILFNLAISKFINTRKPLFFWWIFT